MITHIAQQAGARAVSSYPKIMYLSTLLLIASILSGCANLSAVQGKIDAYLFPTRPGSEEWKQLGSRQKMLETVQIPDERIAAISTAGLVETVLNYPLYMDLMVHNSLDQGLASIKRDFNGMRALMARQDAGSILLQRYQDTDANAASEQSDTTDQQEYVSKLKYLEMILAQPEIGEKLSTEERRSLVQVALQQKAAKERLVNIYGMMGVESTALMAGRTLQLEQALKQGDPHVDQFLRDSTYLDGGALHTISESIFGQARAFVGKTEG
jgi:hypothetical protein